MNIFFEKFNKFLGNLTATFMLLMMFNVFLDVILRYFFNTGSIALQELEWHFFSIMFLFGISYSLNDEAHVRVDFIYDTLPDRKKAIEEAINDLQKNEILIIAGKGHEKNQVRKNQIRFFDDVQVAKYFIMKKI